MGSVELFARIFALSLRIWGIIGLYTGLSIQRFIVRNYAEETELGRTLYFSKAMPFAKYLPDFFSAPLYTGHLLSFVWGWKVVKSIKERSKRRINMAKRTNKSLERIRLQFPLQESASFIGAFMGRTPIKWGWIFLIGPLATFTMKQYQVIVTDKRVIFGRLSLLGTPTTIEQFTYPEIRAVIMKKGMPTYKIGFVFNSRRRLNLNANHKAGRTVEGFLFDEQTGSFLQKAVA